MLAPTKRAAARAKKYAVTPADSSFMAGLIGASIVGTLLAAFSGFYSVSATQHWIVYSGLVAVSFVISYFYAFHRWRKHRREVKIIPDDQL